MIDLVSYSAVFSGPLPGVDHLPRVHMVGPAPTRRMLAPISGYALAAAELLEFDPVRTGLVCVSGATGSTCEAFDGAWGRSEDGRLTSAGFGRSRYKRIHPFTLIRSLQNQVPAALSMRFGMKGPCLNVLESVTAFASLLPNIEAMLSRLPRVLLVLAAAGGRAEEGSKMKLLAAGSDFVEGAICFLFTREGHGERIGSIASGGAPWESGAREKAVAGCTAAPPLRAGVELLRCVAADDMGRRIPLHDFYRFQSGLDWRKR